MRAIDVYTYRHNEPRCVVVYYRKRPYSLATGHGTTDDVCAYRSGSEVYVLCRSQYRSLYVGLSVFDLNDKRESKDGLIQPSGDCFLQNDWEQESVLGTSRWGDLAPHTLVRRMLRYARVY